MERRGRGRRRVLRAALAILAQVLLGASARGSARELGLVLLEGAAGVEERVLLVPWRPFLEVEVHPGRAREVATGAVRQILDGVLTLSAGRSVLPLPEGLASASFLFGPAGGGALRLQGGVDPEELGPALEASGYRVEASPGVVGFRGGDLEGWVEGTLLWARWGPSLEPGWLRRQPARGCRVRRLQAVRAGVVVSFRMRGPLPFPEALAALLPLPAALREAPYQGIQWQLRLDPQRGTSSFRVRLEGLARGEQRRLAEVLRLAVTAGPELTVSLRATGMDVEWSEDLPGTRRRVESWARAFRAWMGVDPASASGLARLEGQGGQVPDDAGTVGVELAGLDLVEGRDEAVLE